MSRHHPAPRATRASRRTRRQARAHAVAMLLLQGNPNPEATMRAHLARGRDHQNLAAYLAVPRG